MSKLKKIVIFLVVLGALIIINLPKEDERIKIEKEFIIDDMTFTGTVLYENKELVNFRPSPENRYECSIEFTIKTANYNNVTNQVILSDDQPIEIEEIFLLKKYEDSNIVMYTTYLRYEKDGKPSQNKALRDGQFIVYLKKENKFFEFRNAYEDLIDLLKKEGYQEYNEAKMNDIYEQNIDKWNYILEEMELE